MLSSYSCSIRKHHFKAAMVRIGDLHPVPRPDRDRLLIFIRVFLRFTVPRPYPETIYGNYVCVELLGDPTHTELL